MLMFQNVAYRPNVYRTETKTALHILHTTVRCEKPPAQIITRKQGASNRKARMNSTFPFAVAKYLTLLWFSLRAFRSQARYIEFKCQRGLTLYRAGIPSPPLALSATTQLCGGCTNQSQISWLFQIWSLLSSGKVIFHFFCNFYKKMQSGTVPQKARI